MLKTRFGKTVEESPATTRQSVKADLSKLETVPRDVLSNLFTKVAQSYPCNIYEIAEIEAPRRGIADTRGLSDAVAAAIYVWDNSEGETVTDVISDLQELGALSTAATPILTELLNLAAPFRESMKVSAVYARVGAPMFDYINGTVDIRCRFHDKISEYSVGKHPTQLVDSSQVIMVNLGYRNPDGEDMVLGFQMDEHDLHLIKRFVENMEKELDLTKSMVRQG